MEPKEMDESKQTHGDVVEPSKSTQVDKENSTESESEQEQLSRSQIKKRRKFESMQKHWEEKKKLRKLKKKQHAANAPPKPNPGEDLSLEERQRLKEEHKKQKEQWLEEMKTSPRVLIDLDFKEYMRDNEISSLCQQVMYSYGTIRRAPRPLRLCLSSVNDIIKEKLEKIKGFTSWLTETSEKDFMTMNQENPFFQYSPDHIVYLSADAEETLTELDPSCLYVIGGIVDRNRYKRLTFDKANRLHIRTAK